MRLRTLLRTGLAALAAACGSDAPSPPGTLVASSVARVTDDAPPGDVALAIDDTTRFAFDVYRRLSATGENVAFSPWSVVSALSMTYAGARGATREAFEDTLHLSLPADRYHRAMNTVDRALDARARGGLRLRSEGQIFTQLDMPIVPSFLELLAAEYGAGVRQLDFAFDPEPARRAINEWISSSTEGLVPELLAEGTIDRDTRLALVNTLYLAAPWSTPFDPNRTAPADFRLSDGSTARVTMMAGEDLKVAYGVVDGVEIIELPYRGEELAMILLVPPIGALDDLEAGLDGARLRALAAAATPGTADVKLPRFEARTQARLDEALRALGLGIAFTGEADFGGITTAEALAITAVAHEAVVKVDEAGTEAGAATAVIIGRVSIPDYLVVDRPFVFAIRDRPTGAVLFVGRILRPPAP
jgi:serpin B